MEFSGDSPALDEALALRALEALEQATCCIRPLMAPKRRRLVPVPCH